MCVHVCVRVCVCACVCVCVCVCVYVELDPWGGGGHKPDNWRWVHVALHTAFRDDKNKS